MVKVKLLSFGRTEGMSIPVDQEAWGRGERVGGRPGHSGQRLCYPGPRFHIYIYIYV